MPSLTNPKHDEFEVFGMSFYISSTLICLVTIKAKICINKTTQVNQNTAPRTSTIQRMGFKIRVLFSCQKLISIFTWFYLKLKISKSIKFRELQMYFPCILENTSHNFSRLSRLISATKLVYSRAAVFASCFLFFFSFFFFWGEGGEEGRKRERLNSIACMSNGAAWISRTL